MGKEILNKQKHIQYKPIEKLVKDTKPMIELQMANKHENNLNTINQGNTKSFLPFR